MNLAQYQQQFDEDDAPGWDAIDNALNALYPTQEPQHYGTLIKYQLGGPDPLDGISVYRNDDHLHLVSYGFSNLYYDEETVGKEHSGFGFELTMRLPLSENEPYWAMNVMQNLARYIFESGKWFEAGQYISGQGSIKQETDSAITSLALQHDPQLAAIDTPHGRVEFLQLYGITAAELERVISEKSALPLLAEQQQRNPLLITHLDRS